MAEEAIGRYINIPCAPNEEISPTGPVTSQGPCNITTRCPEAVARRLVWKDERVSQVELADGCPVVGTSVFIALTTLTGDLAHRIGQVQRKARKQGGTPSLEYSLYRTEHIK